jgi:Protein of unknown function (DUF3303)
MTMPGVIYMVIEYFKNGQAAAVYQCFRASGRMAPAGLEYVTSWVDSSYSRCFQVMQTDDLRLLEEWMAQWRDLIDFEVVPVVTSAEAAAAFYGPTGEG